MKQIQGQTEWDCLYLGLYYTYNTF